MYLIISVITNSEFMIVPNKRSRPISNRINMQIDYEKVPRRRDLRLS
jgi:hypothetical protein